MRTRVAWPSSPSSEGCGSSYQVVVWMLSSSWTAASDDSTAARNVGSSTDRSGEE